MKDDDKGTYFQQADWLQYWSTALLDWQRAYSWAMDGFAQMNAGTVSPAEFFSPENVGAIMAAA